MRALITGITGQDGSYLAELLLSMGYEVFGMARRKSSREYANISHLVDRITILYGDLLDQSSLDTAVEKVNPDEVYNLAAQSFVGISWSQPVVTSDINSLGTLRLLESVRKYAPKSKFYQASSSEMFGKVLETPQKETTPFYPRSPYGISKTYGHYTVVNYRESYGIFACNGICFNHESPRRGIEFVTRKITKGVADIVNGKQDSIILGNIEAKRDWGYAGDYVEAMWLMLQQDKPADYVIATGETHSVKEFCDKAFSVVGLDWRDYVKIDQKYVRPAEVDLLMGDASKIKSIGWSPKCTFDGLVEMMVKADLGK